MVITIIVLGYFAGWLLIARRNWRYWRPDGLDQMVNKYGTVVTPFEALVAAELLALVWPVFVLSMLVTGHQPETTAEAVKRAKEIVDASHREIEELEAELERITVLAKQAQAINSDSTEMGDNLELTGDWSNTSYEKIAGTLRDQFGIAVIRGIDGSVAGFEIINSVKIHKEK